MAHEGDDILAEHGILWGGSCGNNLVEALSRCLSDRQCHEMQLV